MRPMCLLAGGIIVCAQRRYYSLARNWLKTAGSSTVNDVNLKTGAQTVRSRSYLASLPERTARAGAALTGGLVYEASEVMLPNAVRRSKLYQAIVGRLLRITIELVVVVKDTAPT